MKSAKVKSDEKASCFGKSALQIRTPPFGLGRSALESRPEPTGSTCESAREAVIVEEGAVGFGVGLALASNGVFGNEFPIELAGAVFEELLKGEADGAFVFDAELGELGQRFVVNCYLFVCRL